MAAPSLESFIENLPGNVYRRVRLPDGTYRFDYLSSGLFRQFEIDHTRLLAQRPIVFDWIHPDDRERMVRDLEASAAALSLLDHRIRVVGARGQVYWARGIARPGRRADGSVVWDGIVIDVTREVEAEAALRIAKDEADRAHAAATAVIGSVAVRLSAPVESLNRLVEAEARAGLPLATATRIGALLDEIRAALAEFAPAPGPPDPVRGPRLAALTERQREVARLLQQGLSNKLIAQRLGISAGTVKLHVAAILRATSTRSRRQFAQAK